MSQHNDNQYSYTKGLRLKLMHKQGKLPEPDTAAKANLAKLCEAGQHLAEELEKFIYKPQEKNSEILARDRQGEYKPSCDVRINKKWLKQFFKIDFYEQRQQANELVSFSYALQGIARWRAEWRDNLDKLKQADEAARHDHHDQTRRSDIASLLLQLGRKDMFPLIREFARYVNHKNEANPLPDYVEAVEEQLQAALAEYAPAQGAGVVVAAASLNYYTVNKKPKEYYDNEIGELKNRYDKLAKSYEEMKANKARQKSRLLERMLGERLILKQIQNDEELYLFHNTQDLACLEEVYELTKKISRLTAELNKHQSRHSIGTNHYRQLKGQLQNAKQDRGSYFIKRNRHDNKYLQDWWNYCENYKKKAMEFGKLKAQLRGLEKERQESQQFRYWAVFLRRKEGLFLCCIPLHKCREAWKFLEKMATNTGARSMDSEIKLHRFHSITQRALHKLCFAEESSFAADLPRNLQHLLSEANKASNDPEQIKRQRGRNPDQKTKAQLELKFFQTLLKDSNATDSLELSRFDFSKALEAKTLDDFQMAFDQAGYYVETIALDTHRAKTFVDRFKVLEFELTSYDLERRNENTHQTPVSHERRHTELWRQFWKAAKQGKAGNVRLNPELKIRLRKADPDLSEYLRKKRFDLEKTKHRRLQDQYNLHLTMELNAGRLHSDLAFAKADEIDARIDRFNETFNKQNWKKSWKYGIDRGNIELATLCLARFDEDDTYDTHRHGDTTTLLRPRFPQGEEDIKVYTLKREKYNHRTISERETRPIEERREKQVIVNISYFIDKTEDPKWFEQHTCTCIDLTTAKVISGKLITNGDVLTFLKLKYEAAKRVLFDLVAQGKITSKNQQLEWGSEKLENSASIQLRYGRPDSESGTDEKAKKRTVYFFESKHGRNFEGLELSNGRTYTRETIREALQKYLKELLREQAKPTGAANKHVPPIEKINHLRDALVANMVGVIMHLQQHYPGIVILEDLDMDLIQEHFQALNINISRRLEFALYRKFQSLGKVPPHLKDLIQRRERLHAKRKQEIDEAADKEYQKWLSKPKNKNASTSDKEKQKTEYWNQVNSRIRKEKNFSSQIGAIVFVDEYKTSKNCPYCGRSMSWGPEIDKQLKFEQHRFICGKSKSCGFDTGHFKDSQHAEPPLAQPSQGGTTPDFEIFREIDDPDKVAAYNVSKKIQDSTKIARFSNAGEAHGKDQR